MLTPFRANQTTHPMTADDQRRKRDAWVRLCRAGTRDARHRAMCRRLRNATTHEPGTRLMAGAARVHDTL